MSPEREKELIDKLATFVIDRHMETPAILFLESYKPLSFVAGQFGMFYLAPLMPLFGPWSKEGIALLQKRENVERLIQRIEELSEERRKKK
jgi:hypothetical protein